MLPGPTLRKIMLDVEGLVEQARVDMESFGLRMPAKLRTVIQSWHQRTYARGADAAREAIAEQLQKTPEGRAALEQLKLDSTG